MKPFAKISWLLIAFIVVSLSACGGGSPTITPTVDTGPIFTEIASTALALQTQTAQTEPTATATLQVTPTPKPTNTPLITDTPLTTAVTATPLTLSTPLATSQAGCDNMAYVADKTIPDGYVATAGQVLKKTWTVKNLGPCTWNQDYVLIFGWGGQGTKWSTTEPVNLTDTVAPGDKIDITVELTAPTEKGEYVGVFRMQNDKGINFPPGQQVTIDIVVK